MCYGSAPGDPSEATSNQHRQPADTPPFTVAGLPFPTT